MVKCIYIDKFRDNNGNIEGYKLQDENGRQIDIESKQLKQLIFTNQIAVENLQLTADGRLIDTRDKNKEIKIKCHTVNKDRCNLVLKQDKKSYLLKSYDTLSNRVELTKNPAEAMLKTKEEFESILKKSMNNCILIQYTGYEIKLCDRAIQVIKKISAKLNIDIDYCIPEIVQNEDKRVVSTSFNIKTDNSDFRLDLYITNNNAEFQIIINSELDGLKALSDKYYKLDENGVRQLLFDIEIINQTSNKNITKKSCNKEQFNEEPCNKTIYYTLSYESESNPKKCGFFTAESLTQRDKSVGLSLNLIDAAKLTREEAEKLIFSDNCKDLRETGKLKIIGYTPYAANCCDIAIKELRKIAMEIDVEIQSVVITTKYREGVLGFNLNLGKDCLIVLVGNKENTHLVLDAHNNREEHIAEGFSLVDIRLNALKGALMKLKY